MLVQHCSLTFLPRQVLICHQQGVLLHGLWLPSFALDLTVTVSCPLRRVASWVDFLDSMRDSRADGLLKQWLTAFVVAFTLPYLYDPGSGSAGLGVSAYSLSS